MSAQLSGDQRPLTLLRRSILVKYWLSSGAASHGDKVRRVQEQVRARAGRKMCTARPSWMSISQQPLGYKARLWRVRLDMLQVRARVTCVTCHVSRVSRAAGHRVSGPGHHDRLRGAQHHHRPPQPRPGLHI